LFLRKAKYFYETPLGHIKDNKMKKNAFPIILAILILITIAAKYLQ